MKIYRFDKGIPVMLEEEMPEEISCTKIKILAPQCLKNLPNKKRLKKENFKARIEDKCTYLNKEDTIYIGIGKEKITMGFSKLLGYKIGKKMLKMAKYEKPFLIYLKEIEKNNINLAKFLEGMKASDYRFDKYKSKKHDEYHLEVFLITDKIPEEEEVEKYIRELNVVQAISDGVDITRDFVNEPPSNLSSLKYKEEVESIFKGLQKSEVVIYGEEELKNRGMNCHLAVNRASVNEAMTIKITYDPKIESQEEIVLVGKGLTYDSGGLSLKSSSKMLSMKADMAGSAVVLGIMSALERMECKKKVVGYICLAENMVSGNAYKPDDVLKAANGKTIHVKNTDAEGRLVLFDNLVLAEEENPNLDKIYSLATLTGSAVNQFGYEAAGMVGFNEKMKKELKKRGEETEEIWLNAEFHKYMLNSVEDDIADLSNTGTPNQGCQKAGLFLTKSLTKKTVKKYLHCDIAGPSFVDKSFGVNPKGATGWGVSSFLELLKK